MEGKERHVVRFANQARFNAGSNMVVEFAFADEALDQIESIDSGLWNETTTGLCLRPNC